MGKKEAQEIHARRRAMTRFGVTFGPGRQAEAIRQIQAQEAKFLDRQSNRVTVWEVVVEGNTLIAIYDASRKSIATVLTPEQWYGGEYKP